MGADLGVVRLGMGMDLDGTSGVGIGMIETGGTAGMLGTRETRGVIEIEGPEVDGVEPTRTDDREIRDGREIGRSRRARKSFPVGRGIMDMAAGTEMVVDRRRSIRMKSKKRIGRCSEGRMRIMSVSSSFRTPSLSVRSVWPVSQGASLRVVGLCQYVEGQDARTQAR